MKQKIRIETDLGFTKTLNLFGGNLDLVHGNRVDEKLAKQLLDDLKFCALFYKHIIVPDAYFHCYGPLYDILRFERDKKPFWKSELRLLIEKLLSNGVLVPALREGNSLYHNWKNSVAGIVPGGSTCLTLEQTEDNERYLDWVTDKYSTFCRFPETMRLFGRNQFYRSIEKYIFSSNSRDSLINMFATKYKNPTYTEVIAESKDIIAQFAGECTANKDGFRRGVVEVIISEMTGISPYSKDKYSEIRGIAYPEDRSKSLRYNLCRDLLDISNTIYQVLHSLEFNTTGGIFHGHHDWLIDAGLFESQVDLSDIFGKLHLRNIESLLRNETKLRIGMLNADDILRVREDVSSDSGDMLFDRYCNLKIDLASDYDEKSLERFVKYLSLEYLPKINEAATSSQSHSLEQQLFGPLSVANGITGLLINLGAKAICFFVGQAKDIGLFSLNAKDYLGTLRESQYNRKKLEFYLESKSKGKAQIAMTSNKNQYTV